MFLVTQADESFPVVVDAGKNVGGDRSLKTIAVCVATLFGGPGYLQDMRSLLDFS